MSLRRRSRPAAAAVLALAGCGGSGGGSPQALPLAARTPAGGAVRLTASRRDPDEKTPTSWCLHVGYDNGVAIELVNGRSEPGAGSSTCGAAPAPLASGLATVDCDTPLIVVYGGARTEARGVELATSDSRVLTADRAALPAQGRVCRRIPGTTQRGTPSLSFP